MFTESSSTAPVPVNETTTGTSSSPTPTSARFTKPSDASAMVGADDGAIGNVTSTTNGPIVGSVMLVFPDGSIAVALNVNVPSSATVGEAIPGIVIVTKPAVTSAAVTVVENPEPTGSVVRSISILSSSIAPPKRTLISNPAIASALLMKSSSSSSPGVDIAPGFPGGVISISSICSTRIPTCDPATGVGSNGSHTKISLNPIVISEAAVTVIGSVASINWVSPPPGTAVTVPSSDPFPETNTVSGAGSEHAASVKRPKSSMSKITTLTSYSSPGGRPVKVNSASSNPTITLRAAVATTHVTSSPGSIST